MKSNFFSIFYPPGMGWHFVGSQESYLTLVGAGCNKEIHNWYDTSTSLDWGGNGFVSALQQWSRQPVIFFHLQSSLSCLCLFVVVIILQASNTPLPTPTLLTRYVLFPSYWHCVSYDQTLRGITSFLQISYKEKPNWPTSPGLIPVAGAVEVT